MKGIIRELRDLKEAGVLSPMAEDIVDRAADALDEAGHIVGEAMATIRRLKYERDECRKRITIP